MAVDASRSLVGWLVNPFGNFLRTWDYRPVTSWFDNFTINLNSHDAELEEHVLGNVGSYGLQLSRILDAVNLLVSELDLDRLTPEQQRVVVRLEDLAEDVRRSVAEYRGGEIEPAPGSDRPVLLPRVTQPHPTAS
ncbi:hypothetical protein [Pseudonocardia alaniniphila]|uniref:Uncharacterized protein n=1 Tax=Pseudonocardia alaniniphila TaxID=75291 RepID=A0ABS9TIQ0_9PSEU|nr:hypothetical protein [Pseudonocardia alaniniphila]MCH6168421.1 hypothetical protein [Pseudonocardia alaniniphila]